MTRTNWKQVIKAVNEELQQYADEGFKPTLRAMFYRLFSRGMIPNTKSSYDSLGKNTVIAREKGILPPDCFADRSRRVIENFNESYAIPQQVIDARVKKLLGTVDDYYTKFIPRWHDQPNYVEVWIEKDAMASVFETILQDSQVRIVPMKGFGSFTFLYETAQRLKRFASKVENIHILYYGDFDPSGDYMDTYLINRLRQLSLSLELEYSKVDFQRIAVTPQQIRDYNLPFNPDEATENKMKNDTKTMHFMTKYGRLYATELDVLPALIPEEFKQNLVIEQVERYFDEGIYQNLLKKFSPEEIKKLIRSELIESATRI